MKKINNIAKTTKVGLLVILLSLMGLDAAAQQQVITGTVSEMLGKSCEPILGANVMLVNSENRYVK